MLSGSSDDGMEGIADLLNLARIEWMFQDGMRFLNVERPIRWRAEVTA